MNKAAFITAWKGTASVQVKPVDDDGNRLERPVILRTTHGRLDMTMADAYAISDLLRPLLDTAQSLE